MTPDLISKYELILEYCNKFNRFPKLFHKMTTSMPLEMLEKFKALEKFDNVIKGKGREEWQLLDVDDKEIYLAVKKLDTHYQLRVLNRDISSFKMPSLSETVFSTSLDSNNIVTLEATNIKKGLKSFIEIVFAKAGDNVYLVEKDWIWVADLSKWTVESQNIKLTEDDLAALTGKTDNVQI